MRACSCLVPFATIILALSVSQNAHGLGMEAFGPAEHMGISSDWPKGVQPLLKHASRVYWRDVNGYSHSYFQGDVDQVNELLKLFSEVEMKRHRVIFRIGGGSAKSFQGKQTPYNVHFDLPAGLFIFHAKQHAKTGVYSTEPTLEIQVTQEMLADLKRLVIPENVQLHRSQFKLDILLKVAAESDRSTRCRALGLIGEQSVDSKEVRELLAKCLEEEDECIRRNATNAVAALDKLNTLNKEFRDEFKKFIEKHPRLHRSPEPKDVLELLEKTDQKYAKDGFTARGTLVSKEGVLMNWTVTMGNDRLVVTQRAVDEKASGRIEDTVFISPDDMVHIQRSQYWVDGKLTKSKPFKSVEPVGNTYDIFIGRMLWPLGRGLTRRIDRVESVREQQGGTWQVTALGENNLGIRWELEVDPSSDYLIRQAKGFRTRRNPVPAKAEYVVDGVGVVSAEGRSSNHTARWLEGEDAEPISIAIHEVSAEPDLELLITLEDEIVDDRRGDE